MRTVENLAPFSYKTDSDEDYNMIYDQHYQAIKFFRELREIKKIVNLDENCKSR